MGWSATWSTDSSLRLPSWNSPLPLSTYHVQLRGRPRREIHNCFDCPGKFVSELDCGHFFNQTVQLTASMLHQRSSPPFKMPLLDRLMILYKQHCKSWVSRAAATWWNSKLQCVVFWAVRSSRAFSGWKILKAASYMILMHHVENYRLLSGFNMHWWMPKSVHMIWDFPINRTP